MQQIPVIAIHGGAGTLDPSLMTPERERSYHAALQSALEAGMAVLRQGGAALDAVVEAVVALEECPLFNAGYGAVFTADGLHELDASVMEGRERRAGAVAGVTRVRNPVRLARAVLDEGSSVLLAGAGAERLAEWAGLERVEPEWFSTPERWAQLELARERRLGMVLDHDGDSALGEQARMGTVGAVACDALGHLAAATSTGGMTHKAAGRIGDSPIPGAGTWADNATAAVSCTGSGEAFIRAGAAHEVDARMRYTGCGLEKACRAVLEEGVARFGGRGGLIAVDARGRVSMPFTTTGMYRGVWRTGTAPVTAIYQD